MKLTGFSESTQQKLLVPHLLLILLIIIADLAILMDLPFLRQTTGFIFLTLLPGLLILRLMRLSEVDQLVKSVLIIGISISFILLSGYIINTFLIGLGYLTPLSLPSLLIYLNFIFVILIIFDLKTNNRPSFPGLNVEIGTNRKIFLIMPILFPSISALAMTWLNNTNDSSFVMLFILILSVYIIIVCLSEEFPIDLFPITIMSISITLLLLMALRSNHILGFDSHLEYYVFHITLDRLHWNPTLMRNPLDACLSISILPTVYQVILNVQPEILFRLLYPLIYSITPLVVYILSKTYVGNKYAFIASVFFMSQQNFIWTEANARISIAVMFFALAIMLLFQDNIDLWKRKIFFILFISSCMVSHYSTTYILFFMMLIYCIFSYVIPMRHEGPKIISGIVAILFLTLIFLWYSQVTDTAFEVGINFFEKIISNFSDLFSWESRGDAVAVISGKGIGEKAIPAKFHFMLTWLTFGFMGIGIYTTLKNFGELIFPKLSNKKINAEYCLIGLICAALLVFSLIVPTIAKGYSLDRIYAMAIVTLSTFFVIGPISLVEVLFKSNGDNHDKKIIKILLLILIPYFLCITGFTYNIFDNPQSILLNSRGTSYDIMYVHDQESYCAKWLKNNMDKHLGLYADMRGERLISQALISPNVIRNLMKIMPVNGYIYLRSQNLVEREVLEPRLKATELNEYYSVLYTKSKIYDANCSQVLYG